MNKVQIAVILDRSGSMGSVKESTIDNFNEFMESQRTVVRDADVRLIQFDDHYDLVYSTSLKDAPKLTLETFVPRGSTALHDAIGRTIDDLGVEFAARPDKLRPNKVVVLILTDGYENASKKYTQNQVADKIKHQQDVYKWQFVFMGATQDAVLTARNYNILAGHAIATNITDLWKYSTAVRTVSANIAAYANSFDPSAVIPDFTEEQRKAVKIDE